MMEMEQIEKSRMKYHSSYELTKEPDLKEENLMKAK